MDKGKIMKPLIIIYLISILILYINVLLTPKNHSLEGTIDGCCCEAGILKSTNQEMQSFLEDLSDTVFFKLFKVDLDSECPFWAQQLLCSEKSKCIVSRSDESEVPTSWKSQKNDFIYLGNSDISSVVDETSNPSSDDWFCETNDQGVYVNLKLNQEAWTGYQGQRIWDVIYGENCFKEKDMCREEQMFNNLISGLHSSISSHLSEYYFEEGKEKSKPNYKLYFKKVAEYPERIKNLFFIYSVLLRAVNIASAWIKNFEISTGNFQNDLKAKELLEKILEIGSKYCDFPIKEEEFFSDPSKVDLRKQFQAHFYNISKIMDCVECEKCKVYGKMQIAGVGTALKILFHSKDNGKIPPLRRNEFIALINTFGKVSKSLVILDSMFERKHRSSHTLFMVILSCGMVMIIFIYTVMRAWEDMDSKLKRKFRMAGNIERNHLKTN